MVKRCANCNRKKRAGLFYKRKGNSDGLSTICKACWKSSAGRTKRDWHLQSTYGISLEEYELILENQGGRCYVCLNRPGKKALSVDHNHANGRLRGLLCQKCNRYLGHIRDRQAAARRIVKYLKDDGGEVERVLGRDQRFIA